jgi:RNA polymerase sigma factor (sigma-70 family)
LGAKNNVWEKLTKEERIEKWKIKLDKYFQNKNDILFTQDDVTKEQRLKEFSLFQKPNCFEQKYLCKDYSLSSKTITILLSTLTPIEERVVRLYYGIGLNTDHTLEEISQQFSVNYERIRQILKKAIRKLNRPSRLKILETEKIDYHEIKREEERIIINRIKKRRPYSMSSVARTYDFSKESYWKRPGVCKLLWWSYPNHVRELENRLIDYNQEFETKDYKRA